jgi:hypothetical protein
MADQPHLKSSTDDRWRENVDMGDIVLHEGSSFGCDRPVQDPAHSRIWPQVTYLA